MPHTRVKSRAAQPAVIQPSTFDTTPTDGNEMPDASAASKVRSATVVFALTLTSSQGARGVCILSCGSLAQWLAHLEFELFDSRVVPLFHWLATLGKLFTHIASPVSQLQESFRRLSGYGD